MSFRARRPDFAGWRLPVLLIAWVSYAYLWPHGIYSGLGPLDPFVGGLQSTGLLKFLGFGAAAVTLAGLTARRRIGAAFLLLAVGGILIGIRTVDQNFNSFGLIALASFYIYGFVTLATWAAALEGAPAGRRAITLAAFALVEVATTVVAFSSGLLAKLFATDLQALEGLNPWVASLTVLVAAAGLLTLGPKAADTPRMMSGWRELKEAIRLGWQSASVRFAVLARMIAFPVAALIPMLTLFMQLGKPGEFYALAPAAGTVAGLLAGGWFADRCASDPARQLRIASIAIGLAAPPFLLALLASDGLMHSVWMGAATGCMSASLPAAYAGVTAQFPAERRTAATAAFYLAVLSSATFGTGFLLAGLFAAALGFENWQFGARYPGALEFHAGNFPHTWNFVAPVRIAGSITGDVVTPFKFLSVLLVLTLLGPVMLFRLAAKRATAIKSPVSGTVHCVACGAQARSEAKFCIQCGAALPAAPAGMTADPQSSALLPQFMPAVGLVAIAGLSLAGTIVVSGLLDPGWGKSALWDAPESSFQTTQRCSDAACLIQEMQYRGASRDAVRFAEAFSEWQSDGPGYAVKFHELGRIDVMEVVIPSIGQGGDLRTIIVNKRTLSMPLSSEEAKAMLRTDPATAEIWRTFPNAEVWYHQGFMRQEPRPGGGQRLIFASHITDQCRACDVIGQVEVAYDFDAKGELIGRSVLPVGPDANWRQSIARRQAAITSPPVVAPTSDDLSSPAPQVIQPSFACGRASTNVERLICADATLAKKDADMSTQYVEQLRAYRRGGNAGAADQIQANQQRWRSERDRCADLPCLHRVYDRRLTELDYGV